MRAIIFFGICLFRLLPLGAQVKPDWGPMTPKIYEPLHRETADSIAFRRAESAALRAEMDKIVAKKGLDRAMIFGAGDIYFQEGMYKNFKEEPGPMQVAMDRDADIVRLENLHVALYRSDKALFRWLDIENRVKGKEGEHSQFYWDMQAKKLPPTRQQALGRNQGWIQWATNAEVCAIATDISSNLIPKPTEKPKPLGASFDALTDASTIDGGKDWTLPLAADKILASFPMNGQFAFCPDESIPGIGYVAFPKAATALLSPLLYANDNANLKARWTSGRGDLVYTNVNANNYAANILYFTLPTQYFQPDQLYKLELVSIPEEALTQVGADDLCWQKLREGSPKAMPKAGSIAGETKITELYFRVGHYSLRARTETMRGAIDWSAGTIMFSTDEPLDELEMRGGPNFPPPVNFMVQSEGLYNLESKLQDKALFYYLTVPRIEDLSQLEPGALAVAERDNTLDAAFVRQVKLAQPDNYISLPDTKSGPQPLSGGYLAPALSKVFAPDTLLTESPVPQITKLNFVRGSVPGTGQLRCTLIVGELRQYMQAIRLQQEQIRKRMAERAAFFYELAKRRNQRDGTALPGNLEYFQQQEKNNLPESAQYLLGLNADETLRKGFTVYYSRFFPGTKQRTADLPIKF